MLIMAFCSSLGHEVCPLNLRTPYVFCFVFLIANLWLGCMLENLPPHSNLAAAFCNPSIYSRSQIYVAGIYPDMISRLMSDYEVTLVNDNSKSTPLPGCTSIH
jgi:hypothetical protein